MDRPWYRRLFSRAVKPLLRQDPRSLAEDGNAAAQFALGLQSATSPSHDYVQAAQWYRKAADQNHSLAQFNLGVMFAQGQGMERNDTTALSWISKAAEAGDPSAQFNLGTRYHRISMEQVQPEASESRIESYKWFHLSTAQGYKNSVGACELVSLRMTHDEVSEGNRRVASFVEKK